MDHDLNQEGFWVFGYGSLMWNPGFAFAERVPAVLVGYARSFCMWSIHHRGTPEEPGLVLALDLEDRASCQKMEVAAANLPPLVAAANLRPSAEGCRGTTRR